MTAEEMLKDLVKANERLQMTAPVDNDFPEVMHDLDNVIRQAKGFLVDANTLKSSLERAGSEIGDASNGYARSIGRVLRIPPEEDPVIVDYVDTPPLTFDHYREINLQRSEQGFNHHVMDWSATDWGCAMSGEVGELAEAAINLSVLISASSGKALDALKKMRRLQTGTHTDTDPKTIDEAIENIASEIPDIIGYCDLFATRLGLKLSDILIKKFNIVSDRVGSDIKL